ncbi:hypothetical protein MMUR_05570 [Mycolicibacterium murale]|uniref:Uncharacterized protein n=1 Tax=Mycolicibacterium murale TaxID=182220 RepID=A0A7I9WF90_9MYCO|nr:hypothetical protein [Mycolicibacterium murale]MCV7182871.1 hypothetical protein [Mycolicibacterium murale]GFG56421.1 hypothetical protein MMUR_05570 [Mycolicibacterium murale]
MAQLDCKQQCTFCRNYEAPTHAPTLTDRLDAAVTGIDSIRTDLNAVIRELSDDTPMFVIVDIVNALYNLRNASVVLDKATDALEVDAEAVLR